VVAGAGKVIIGDTVVRVAMIGDSVTEEVIGTVSVGIETGTGCKGNALSSISIGGQKPRST